MVTARMRIASVASTWYVSLLRIMYKISANKKLFQAVDSCMGKLLAENGDADELLELLSSPNDCIREELEDFVDPKTQPYLLSQVMRMNGATEKAIPILMK